MSPVAPQAVSRLPALAWLLAGVTVVASTTAVVLEVLVRPVVADVTFTLGQALLGIGYAVTGAVVASRVHRNICGWILIAIGLFQGISNIGFMVALAVGQTPESAHGAPGALMWVANWIWFPSLMLLATFLPLLFPDGHLPSRRWRWFGRLAAALLVLGTAATAAETWRFMYLAPDDGGSGLESLLFGGLLVAGVGSIASLFVRYHRSSGEQRQQLKVIALGGAAALVGILLTFASEPLLLPALILLLALPAAVAIAILRHRLFEIDRLISRSVSYLILSGLLAGVYAVGVFGLRPVVTAVTGDSALSVAISTIAVAAMFGPARRRIQGLVDRRFNRSRYDAIVVVDTFSGRLRDALDLDELRRELVAVAAQTVAPTAVALWLVDDAQG